MRIKQTTVLIAALVLVNVALLAKVFLMAPPTPTPVRAPPGIENHLATIDTLALESWNDRGVVVPGFEKPTFLFLFSKQNCQSCIEEMIDLLSAKKNRSFDVYIISVDLYTPEERVPYLAKFFRALPFYALKEFALQGDSVTTLPALLVVDTYKRIVFAKQVLPFPTDSEALFRGRLHLLLGAFASKENTGPR